MRISTTSVGKRDRCSAAPKTRLPTPRLAVSNGQGADYNNAGSRYEQFLMRRLREAGQHKRANAILSKQMATFANQVKGRLFGLNYTLLVGHIRNGDTNAAESYAARNRSLLAEAQRWPVFPIYGANWQAMVEDGNARVAEARGRLADAETAFRKAAIFYTATLKTVSQWESKPQRENSSAPRIGRSRWKGASRSSKDGSAKAKPTCAGPCSAASPSPENSMPIRQAFFRCWCT